MSEPTNVGGGAGTPTPPTSTPVEVPTPDFSEAPSSYELRQGNLVRVSTGHSVDAVCVECGLVINNTGAAASHARSARHQVHVEYMHIFDYLPIRRVGE